MPRYFATQYDTDMGYSFYGVALSAITSVTVPNGKKTEDFLPQNLLGLYQYWSSGTTTCSTSGVFLRYVYIVSIDGGEHKIEIPINGFDSRWQTMIDAYKNDSSILSFRIGGERIKESKLAVILNK
ncbi:hypothetical protein [Spirulina sp. 06S082]|uniref:hypothetical protein n=1 Tax=Spirulina sp. 06S082 TaxID=3110248 RepID=UPI002B21C47D|nr:hypothetical protein [Spirulina sp. 06S082]MEA5467992.1 hypothetical protein [Spirulina sp. 06S082]